MRCKSFTLIELIVVIAIIAILAAIISVSVFKAIEKAKVSAAIADMTTLKTAIGALYADTGHWISDNAGAGLPLLPGQTNLDTDFDGWDGWDGPYIEKVKGMHPWGGRYQVTSWSWNGVGGALEDLVLEIEDTCFPSGPNFECPIPEESAWNIDEKIDDGDPGTGNFFGGDTGAPNFGMDCHWVLVTDFR